jgi:hypothetical protein
MAKFFFDVRHEGQILADEIGAECENIGEAFKTAKYLITYLKEGYDSASADWSSWMLAVTYQDHSGLFELPFTLMT